MNKEQVNKFYNEVIEEFAKEKGREPSSIVKKIAKVLVILELSKKNKEEK